MLIASHELDRARALSTREVAVVAGRVEGGIPDAAPTTDTAPTASPAEVVA